MKSYGLLKLLKRNLWWSNSLIFIFFSSNNGSHIVFFIIVFELMRKSEYLLFLQTITVGKKIPERCSELLFLILKILLQSCAFLSTYSVSGLCYVEVKNHWISINPSLSMFSLFWNITSHSLLVLFFPPSSIPLLPWSHSTVFTGRS